MMQIHLGAERSLVQIQSPRLTGIALIGAIHVFMNAAQDCAGAASPDGYE
jgi:hypothetical protein